MRKTIMTALGICTLAGTIFFGASNSHAALGHVTTTPQTTVQSNANQASNTGHNAYGNSDTCNGIWNGQAWSGSWNGHAWNGSWNGHSWNGFWNGHAWNGRAWDGHVWNASTGNGAWNGTWNGHTANGHPCSVNWNN